MRNDPQGIGSALTYARRYALQAIAGVAAEDDDDGNAAGRRDKPPAGPTGMLGANGRTPPPAGQALAGAYSQRLAVCRTQAEYAALCQEIKSAVAARRLTNGDRDTLLAAAREAASRFPEAAGRERHAVANGTPVTKARATPSRPSHVSASLPLATVGVAHFRSSISHCRQLYSLDLRTPWPSDPSVGARPRAGSSPPGTFPRQREEAPRRGLVGETWASCQAAAKWPFDGLLEPRFLPLDRDLPKSWRQ